ncbi:MAG TPA: hypothetical protein VK936_12830 [Longimicrobiales bacterium]|nr:hypothetical protein [Longimicrobiales bacterium]
MNGSVTVADAQREVRTVYAHGAVGQAVSGAIWLASAAAASAGAVRPAIIILVIGGMFIFPLTQAIFRLGGRSATLSDDNPLTGLAMQVAFIVPLTLPVAGAAALYDLNWFYPAVMIIVGAHYLPFIFLYGMRAFGVLAAGLMAGGFLVGLRLRDSFAAGAWLTAVMLLAFAGWAALAYRRTGAPAIRSPA